MMLEPSYIMLRFKRGNVIPHGQDMGFHIGIPYNIEFSARYFEKDRIKLIADGYGNLEKPNSYGNGAIYVTIKFLYKNQQRIINQAIRLDILKR